MRSYSLRQQSILQTSISDIPLEKRLKRYMSANVFEGAGNGYSLCTGLLDLNWRSLLLLPFPSNLCLRFYELVQERIIGSVQLFSSLVICSSGSQTQGTFLVWLVTWLLAFRLAAFYILTLTQFIPVECFQIILSRLLGIGLLVSLQMDKC